MSWIDVFNGDADGICALHQLRLADPVESELVTGVKRDINLLERVVAGPGDQVTVLDISLDTNRAGLLRLLASGSEVRYFDHHFAGEIPVHGAFKAHIDTASDVCTSLLVDLHLGGRFRPWTIVAAFGDGLKAVGWRLAREAGLSEADTSALALLGECMNYNAYGESVADLWFPPAELYRAVRGFAKPLDFLRESPVFGQLNQGYQQDLTQAAALRPLWQTDHGTVYLLPAAPWARRVIGVFANRLAQALPERAHALLSANASGGYTVSVRAPVARPTGADDLCRRFATGGGRQAAAGINELPEAEVEGFVAAFGEVFAPNAGS